MDTSSASFSSPAGLVELQGLLLAMESLEDFLTELARLTCRQMNQDSSAGVTVRPGGRARTVASSDRFASQIDEVQYARDQGPCLEVIDSGEVLYVPDLSRERRWPDFVVNAIALGAHASLSLPLTQPGGTVVGALNLYSRRSDPYDQAARELAVRFAGGAAGAVALALRIADQAKLSEDLRAALDARSVIDQALGILMAQRRCDAAATFEVLRRTSQQRNVKLREVAETIVTTVSGKEPRRSSFHPG